MRGWPALAWLVLGVWRCASAEDLPPPEVEPGRDYVAETRDSVGPGSLEWIWNAHGELGNEAVESGRRVRFQLADLEGEVREGERSELGPAELESRREGSEWTLGRLSPRWGNGLLLGTPVEPWSRVTSDRGRSAPLRGRAGEGAHWRGRQGAVGVEALVGDFSGRRLVGGRLEAGGAGRAVALEWLGSPARRGQAGLALSATDASLESVWDARGSWRGEAWWGWTSGAWRVVPGIRLGRPGFRSLAEPKRAGPPGVLRLGWTHQASPWRVAGSVTQWQWREGRVGSRLALEAERRFAEHGPLVLGWEERSGPQRERLLHAGRRQSWWGELGAGGGFLRLASRYERSGLGPWGRDLAREVSELSAEGRLSRSVRWRIGCVTYWTGEAGHYLTESEPGHWWIRSVTGRGQRTSARVTVPSRSGSFELQVTVSEPATKPGRVQWQTRWVRRASLERGRRSGP